MMYTLLLLHELLLCSVFFFVLLYFNVKISKFEIHNVINSYTFCSFFLKFFFPFAIRCSHNNTCFTNFRKSIKNRILAKSNNLMKNFR